jgi:hypothetical protein
MQKYALMPIKAARLPEVLDMQGTAACSPCRRDGLTKFQRYRRAQEKLLRGRAEEQEALDFIESRIGEYRVILSEDRTTILAIMVERLSGAALSWTIDMPDYQIIRSPAARNWSFWLQGDPCGSHKSTLKDD